MPVGLLIYGLQEVPPPSFSSMHLVRIVLCSSPLVFLHLPSHRESLTLLASTTHNTAVFAAPRDSPSFYIEPPTAMSSHFLSPPSTPDSIGYDGDCVTKTDTMGDQRLTSCKTAVAQIEAVLKSHPHAWRNYLQSARSVITAVNSISSIGTADWTWIVAVLQDLGFADADDGGVADISNWCQSQWLAILESRPNNTAALRGWS